MLEIVKIKDIIKGRTARCCVETKSQIDKWKDKVDLIKIEEIYMTLDGKLIVVLPDEYRINKKETE